MKIWSNNPLERNITIFFNQENENNSDKINHPSHEKNIVLWKNFPVVQCHDTVFCASDQLYTPDCGVLWPLLLTWFNFNPSMDK